MWALGKRVDIWDYFHFHFTFTFFFLHYSTLPLSLSPSFSVGLSLSVYFSPNSSPPHSLSSWEVFKIPTLCFQKPSLLSYLRFECRHKSQRFFFLLAFIFNFLTQSFVWKRDLLPILRVSNKRALLRWRVVYFFF